MARISGITIEKDASGNARYIRVDLRKYGKDLAPFLKKLGLENEKDDYDPEFVAKIKAREKEKIIKVDLENLWK